MAEDDGEHGKSVYVVHNHTSKPMKLLGTTVLFHSCPFQSANKSVKVIHAVTDAVRLNQVLKICCLFPGGLVREILKTKKELEGGGNQEPRPRQVSFILLRLCYTSFYNQFQ